MNQKTKNIIQVALLGLILIILPGGSWFYLKWGLEYQKDSRAELKELGKFDLKPLFDLAALDIENINSDERLKLLCFWDENSSIPLIEKLHDQFEKSDGIEFVIVQDKSSAMEFTLKGDISYLNLTTTELQKMKSNLGKPEFVENEKGKLVVKERPSSDQTIDEIYPYFILIDQENNIRNYYDIRKEQQVSRMVEHIAILIPQSYTKGKQSI